ncbi:MAG: peptidylprolyl isomerase, partial [Planctomycetaceae bacterium]|nr:peptidylprolyl isomerase [Planctomycetaceae bacterium]
SAEDYVEFWKKEQELRAAEAEAVGTENQLPRVVLKTTKGEIEVELFENEAPNTVANFISLVDGKKYDGIAFHRVIPNFMIQGGDPNTLDENPANDGQGGPGYTIDCECYREDSRKHFRGSLSMAHAGKDTGGSQFFITHLPTHWLNVDRDAERGHTVFGRVVKGLEVLDQIEAGDRIEAATVTVRRDHAYKPETKPDPTAPPAADSEKKESDEKKKTEGEGKAKEDE